MACLCVTCREAQRTIRRAAVVSLDIISKIKCNIIYLKSKKRAKLIGKAVISMNLFTSYSISFSIDFPGTNPDIDH
jgi:hypothetical protein